MVESIKSSVYLVDASFVLAFLLPDERKEQVNDLFEAFEKGTVGLYSSPLLPYEVLNTLKTAVAKKRITAAKAIDLGKTFLELDIRFEELNFLAVFELALRKKLTVYDASYAWLAGHTKMPLLSFDRALSA